MVVWCLNLLLLFAAIIHVDALPRYVKLPLVHSQAPTLAVVVVGVVLIFVIVTIVFILCYCCCTRCSCFPQPRRIIYTDDNNVTSQPSQALSSGSQKSNKKIAHELLNFETRQFSYHDLERITRNFRNNIGTGGFGSVYVGSLKNGNTVAVKIRSHSSAQGVKEFLAEAGNLTRVHHINLVSLIGYCPDENCMALVYEYMSEGTLQDKLRNNSRPLTWKQRLRIAIDSAIGLEYLHKGCNPPLVHRDVKSNNILLNANLEAKIADFGLSRAFKIDASTDIATSVVGTPGYLDPEYFSSLKLSQKSDVYSFGVVLLEIVTGKPPIIPGEHGGHLVEWVCEKLSRGSLDDIADPRMQGQYDVNSVWKVTNLACKCTDNASIRRPTMNTIVTELKESLDLDIATEETRNESTALMFRSEINYHRNNYTSDVSVSSSSETRSETFNLGLIPGPRPGPR